MVSLIVYFRAHTFGSNTNFPNLIRLSIILIMKETRENIEKMYNKMSQ